MTTVLLQGAVRTTGLSGVQVRHVEKCNSFTEIVGADWNCICWDALLNIFSKKLLNYT